MNIKQAIRTLTRQVKDLKNISKITVSADNNGLATPEMLQSFTPINMPDRTDIFKLKNGYYKIIDPVNGPTGTGGSGSWLVRITGWEGDRIYEAHLTASNRYFKYNQHTGSQLMPRLWQEQHSEATLWRGSVYKKGSTITLLDSLQNYSKCKIQFYMFGNYEERTFYSPVSSDANQFNNTIVPSTMAMTGFNMANGIPATNAMNILEYSLQCNSDKTALTLNYVNPHTWNMDNSNVNNDDFVDAFYVMSVIGVR